MFLDKCLVAHYLKAPLVWPVSFPAVASCKTSEIRPDMGNEWLHAGKSHAEETAVEGDTQRGD